MPDTIDPIINPSENVAKAADNQPAKLPLGIGSLASLESMSPNAKQQAGIHARRLLGHEVSVEGSLFQRNFITKVDAKVREINKGRIDPIEIGRNKITNQYSDEYLAVMQEMFNAEIIGNAKQIQAEEEAKEGKAKEDAKKKASEDKLKQSEAEEAAELKALDDTIENRKARIKKRKFDEYSGLSSVTSGIATLAITPANVLAGFAQFLNDCAPDGHKDEFLLLVKLFQGLGTIIELPFFAIKKGLDTLALKNATPEEAKSYQAYLKAEQDAKDKPNADNAKKAQAAREALDDAKEQTALNLEKKQADALGNSTGGDVGTGVGVGGRE